MTLEELGAYFRSRTKEALEPGTATGELSARVGFWGE